MPDLRKILHHEYVLVFLFCMAVLVGPAISILFQFDLTNFHDCLTYLGLAHFDFHQSPVRRYRVIVPLLSAGVNYLSGGLFSKMAPGYFIGDFSYPFSFFVVNLMLTAYFGLLVYRYCLAYGVSRTSALIGTLAMLTCRYTIYMVALPLVDSLFCVVIALTLLGLKLKHTGMLLAAIFIGPFSKEAFIFIAPLIFFFGHINKARCAVFFLSSGILVFSFRYGYEIAIHEHVGAGLSSDLAHVNKFFIYAVKLVSPSNLFKILFMMGMWTFAPLLTSVFRRNWIKELFMQLDGYLLWFMVAVIIQMILSGCMERMFYLCMPVFCVVVALSVHALRKTFERKPEHAESR